MTTKLVGVKERGFTFIEVLVVIATIALLAGFLLPALVPSRGTGHHRIHCVSNLKQIGLAMRMFSNDHEDKFPWAVPGAKGGSMEYSNSAEVFRHYLAVSNELTTPKVLLCPEETTRVRVNEWKDLSNTNISYFAGLDADEGKPNSLLSGDRTLSIDSNAWSGVMVITGSSSLRVLPGLHANGINIGLGDGSAQQMTEQGIQKLISEMNELPVKVVVP
jgi:prepilin-type N-terminal cleavage/methylation domain-containing protein